MILPVAVLVITTEPSSDVSVSSYTSLVYWPASFFAIFRAFSVFPVMMMSFEILSTPLNAFSFTSAILSGRMMLEIPPTLANAPLPITVTESGIVTFSTLPLYLYNTLSDEFIVNPDDV